MVVLWGIVVPHIAHASFCDTVDCCRQRSRACVTMTDPFSIMEKSDESQFFENMTIYLKTRKMLSQWTKQTRWRIKKSIPSFVLRGTYTLYSTTQFITHTITSFH